MGKEERLERGTERGANGAWKSFPSRARVLKRGWWTLRGGDVHLVERSSRTWNRLSCQHVFLRFSIWEGPLFYGVDAGHMKARKLSHTYTGGLSGGEATGRRRDYSGR